MEKLFFREKIKRDYAALEEGAMLDRQKFAVGVVGVGEGAGATFTAMGLAFIMGEMTAGVTFAEGRPHGKESVSPYRMLYVDKAFRNRIKQGQLNLYKKVNWNIYEPDEKKDRERTGDFRQLPGRIIIVDNPDGPEDYEKLDMIVAVTDPYPPRIMAGLETYSRLRRIDQKGSTEHIPVLWLLNKSDEGTARKEAECFLKIKFDFEQEILQPDIFYRAAYSCQQPYYICGKSSLAGLNRLAAEILNTI